MLIQELSTLKIKICFFFFFIDLVTNDNNSENYRPSLPACHDTWGHDTIKVCIVLFSRQTRFFFPLNEKKELTMFSRPSIQHVNR